MANGVGKGPDPDSCVLGGVHGRRSEDSAGPSRPWLLQQLLLSESLRLKNDSRNDPGQSREMPKCTKKLSNPPISKPNIEELESLAGPGVIQASHGCGCGALSTLFRACSPAAPEGPRAPELKS